MTAILKDAKRGLASPLAIAIVATSCTFVAVVRGAADTFAVFLIPLERALDIGHAEAASIFALSMIAIGITGPFAGALVDRLGARCAYAAGTTILIGAFAAASVATTLWQLQLALGIGVGIAVACVGTSAQGPLIARWFKGRETTIFGVVGGTAGLGALVFAPLAQFLIDESGWRGAYRSLAMIVSLLLLPLLLLPWRRIHAGPPEDAETRARWAPLQAGDRKAEERRVFRDPLLWRIFISHFLTCAAVYGVQVLIVAYLVDRGYVPLVAAAAVGLAGLSTALGMVSFAWLADRIGWRPALTASFAATGIGLAALWAMTLGPEPWLLLLYIPTFGLSVGSRGPLVAGLAIRRFAGPATGRVLGGILLAFGLGSATGAWLAGNLHEATGGYGAGFSVSAVALAAAFVQWWIWPDPTRVPPLGEE